MPEVQLQNVSFDSHFVDQFERDPRNIQLHVCMTSFFAPENGRHCQAAAYLEKVIESLPPINEMHSIVG